MPPSPILVGQMRGSQALPRLHFHVANVLVRLRRFEAAANAYARALRAFPDDAAARFQHAWCLIEVPGRRAEGIDAFQRLLRVRPSASGFYLLACGLQRESRHAEAVDAFREVLRREAGTSALFYNYALSLEAIGSFEDAANAYRDAAMLDPCDAAAWAAAGSLLGGLCRWAEAVSCLERVERAAPSTAHTIELIEALTELDRLDEAKRVVDAALERAPHSVELRERLADVLAGLDRHEEAITLARRLCRESSDSPSSLAVLAGTLTAGGDLDQALAVARASVEAAPDEAAGHWALGAVHIQRGNGAAALAAFDRLAEILRPGQIRQLPGTWIRASTARAVALTLLDRHAEAMRLYDDVLAVDPTYFERWHELGPHYRCSREAAGPQSPTAA